MDNFLKEKTISISILNVDDLDSFLSKLDEIRKKQRLNNIVIHFDVMDEVFVPNSGIDFKKIKTVKKYDFYTDVHLMCSKPINYIEKVVALGADNITIHYEIDNLYDNLKYLNNIKQQLKKIDKNLTIGISIKPSTDIKKIFNYVDMCDVILLMSVEPGLGGQKYINKINKKIEFAVDMKKMVQIDGGINDETIIRPNELGISSFVIGSYITKDLGNMEDKILKIEKILNGERG